MSIDPVIRAFIDESERFYPPDAARLGVAEQRRLYYAYAQAFAVARPAGIVAENGSLAVAGRTIGLRRYRRGDASSHGSILYAHGGGFILGSLDSHDGVVARIAERSGADVIAIDYRLAPEHPCPAALDDVLAVVEAAGSGALPWSDAPSAPLVLAGDSAGGTLVAAAALRLSGRDRPLAGLALIYPMLGREPALPAAATEADAPMLTLADVRRYRDLYLGGAEPALWTFPLDAPSLAGLPPSFLIAAEHDPLRDDATRFAARLTQSGVPAECRIGQGLVHGFLRALGRSRAADAALDDLIAFVRGRIAAS